MNGKCRWSTIHKGAGGLTYVASIWFRYAVFSSNWLVVGFSLSFSRELHRTLEPLKLPFGFELIDWNFNSISEWRIAGFQLEITSESLTANSIIWRRDWKFGRVLPTLFSFQMRSPTVLFNFSFFKPLNIQIEWLNHLRRTLLSLLKWQGITPGCDRIPSSSKFTHRTQALVLNQVFAFVSMGISSVEPKRRSLKDSQNSKIHSSRPIPAIAHSNISKIQNFSVNFIETNYRFRFDKIPINSPKEPTNFSNKINFCLAKETNRTDVGSEVGIRNVLGMNIGRLINVYICPMCSTMKSFVVHSLSIISHLPGNFTIRSELIGKLEAEFWIVIRAISRRMTWSGFHSSCLSRGATASQRKINGKSLPNLIRRTQTSSSCFAFARERNWEILFARR